MNYEAREVLSASEEFDAKLFEEVDYAENDYEEEEEEYSIPDIDKVSDLHCVKLFVRDSSFYKQLSREREIELSRVMKLGGPDAKAAFEELVCCNNRLALYFAKRYTVSGLPLEDLISYACMGLIKAAGNYDAEKETRFSTYAAYWIINDIRRGINASGRTIHIPNRKLNDITKLRSAEQNFRKEFERKPTDAELSQILGITELEVREIKALDFVVVSLDTHVGEEGDANRTMGEQIPDKKTPGPVETAEKHDLHARIIWVLGNLNPREADIVKKRYGIEDGRERTLEELAREYNVSRERIRQIELNALAKIRNNGELSCQLIDYAA